jgi:hypothetical protein
LFRLLFAFLAAASVASADLWACDWETATFRTIGYYDTNYASTECGKFLFLSRKSHERH